MDNKDTAQGEAAPLFRPVVVSVVDPASGYTLGQHLAHPDSLQSNQACLKAFAALYDAWRAANAQTLELDTTQLDFYVLRK